MAEPLHVSRIELDLEAFEAGAAALGITRGGRVLYEQQRQVAGVCDAGERFVAISMPRRSTKTTSVMAWALGRCLADDGLQVAFTAATSGKSARDRFMKDAAVQLDKVPNPPWRVKRSAGMERVEFNNGSLFQVMAPSGDDFRGQQFDKVIVDEAQEAKDDESGDLLAAILPTMDTQQHAQLILSGTAGKARTGNLLWDQLERGRHGDGGILEYGVAQDTSVDAVSTWAEVEPLLLACHPGIGTLTTLEIIRANFDRIANHALFASEYLGLWGLAGSSVGVFEPARWNDSELAVEQLPEPPERFGLAFAAAPSQLAAAIVAAWRDESGHAHLLLIDHRAGTRWLARRLTELSLRYRLPVSFDNFGVNIVEVDKLTRQKPRPTLNPLDLRGSSTAAAKLVEEVRDGNVFHYGQDALTEAVLTARRRPIGPKGYAFGRPSLNADIAAVEAASIALHAFDQSPAKARVTILRPTPAA